MRPPKETVTVYSGPLDLPRVSEAKPFVCALDLVTVADDLLEDSELVTDAVTACGVSECRGRLENARGEAPEAAVAKPSVRLEVDELVEIETEVAQHRAVRFVDVKRLEVRDEGAPEEELGREVIRALCVRLAVRLLRLDPALHEAVTHRERERNVAVVRGRALQVTGAGELHVVGERTLEHDGVHAGAIVFDEDLGARCGRCRRGSSLAAA